jgi:sterol desaturase/sphingolipid hydroxylase (fatty acid hydroxylase superfamily)
MQELLTQYPGILGIMLLLSIAEWGWARFYAKRGYDVGASLASFGVAFGQSIIKPATAFIVIGTYAAVHSVALWHFAMDDWRIWVAGFFAVEFAYYWFHRWSHNINWLWATHAVHHSANELTLPAAIRLGWTGVLSGGWLIFAPLIFIGFPPAMVAILLALNLLYQFGLHTEAIRKLGPFERVFNTPSHHRAHHSSDEKWLDCNFGGVLIIFDRMFGTFVPEPDQGGLRYGLTYPIFGNNPVTIALRQWMIMWHNWQSAPNWSERRDILVGRPGMLRPLPARPTGSPEIATGAATKRGI